MDQWSFDQFIRWENAEDGENNDALEKKEKKKKNLEKELMEMEKGRVGRAT